MTRPRVLAFVMAGGEGTRLRPFTEALPKPALPFGGRHCIIDFVLSNLYNSSIGHVYVLLQYRPEALLHHLSETWAPLFHAAGRRVSPVLPERTPGGSPFLGTADSVRRCLDLIEAHAPEVVAVFAADHVYRMDVQQMVRFHQQNCADATVAAVPVPLARARDFGVIATNARRRIHEFLEKPDAPMAMPDDPGSAYASMGNYVFEPEILRYALVESAQRNEHDFGRHVLPRLVKTSQVYAYNFAENHVPGVRAYEEQSYWRDIGNVEAYVAAHRDTLGQEPCFDIENPHWPILPHRHISRTTAASAAISNALEPDTVARGAVVSNSVLHKGARVEAGAQVYDCIIMERARIGRGACVRNAVVGAGSVIDENTHIGYDATADRLRYAVMPSGVVIVPPASDARFGPHSMRRTLRLAVGE